MKFFAILSLAGSMLATAAFAQPGNDWQMQWLATKYGRTFATNPTAQNLMSAGPALGSASGLNVSDRDAKRSAAPVLPWREQWFKAKYGRYSAAWESQHRTSLPSDATDDQVAVLPSVQHSRVPVRNTCIDQLIKVKYGR